MSKFIWKCKASTRRTGATWRIWTSPCWEDELKLEEEIHDDDELCDEDGEETELRAPTLKELLTLENS